MRRVPLVAIHLPLLFSLVLIEIETAVEVLVEIVSSATPLLTVQEAMNLFSRLTIGLPHRHLLSPLVDLRALLLVTLSAFLTQEEPHPSSFFPRTRHSQLVAKTMSQVALLPCIQKIV